MGVTSSKADNYVLRFEGDLTPTSSLELNKPAPYSRKPTKVHPVPSQPPSEKRLQKSKSQIVVPTSEKQALARTLASRPSAPNLFINLKSSEKGVRCAEKYPWLVKNADFSSLNLNEFEFGRVIGRGLMGTVRICKTSKSGKYFVLKSIRKDYIQKHNDHRHVKNERLVLSTLNSPFCIKLFGTFQDRNYVHFALEYCPGGELFQRLGRKKSFAPSVAKFYATEIFSALEHIQSLGFVYRDLKPENVILDEEGHCKLVDFGFSRPCSADDRIHTLCGTPAYLSPEQLDGKLTNGYTRVVDWWSYGVLLYELLTGKTPFSKNQRESHYEIFLRILKSKIWYPYNFDSKSKELISALCHANVEKRLCDVTMIRSHPYYEVPWDIVNQRKLIPPFVPKLKEDGDSHYFSKYNDSGLPINFKSEDAQLGEAYFSF